MAPGRPRSNSGWTHADKPDRGTHCREILASLGDEDQLRAVACVEFGPDADIARLQAEGEFDVGGWPGQRERVG
jgi:hypothetical protein